jgi:alcohol dehydrogenase (cytochrome c)
MFRKYLPILIILAVLTGGVSVWAASSESADGQAGEVATETQATEAAAAGTVWDGIYTIEQQERGQLAYEANCAACHNTTLRGTPGGPGIAGARFIANWKDRSVGEFLAYIEQNMPIGRAGSLPGETYADIVSYILSVNEFPSGDTPLSADPADLEQVLITREP